MNPHSIHADSLRMIQTEMGKECPVITWKTLTIKVLPGGLRLKGSNSPGGISLDTDFQFTCLAADFGATLPISNQLLGYNGNALKIESVTVAANGFQIRINANHAAQRA